MTCPCDNTKRRMPKCDAGTPPVLEIDGGETPVLFHTVNIPASVGDDTTIPPTPGAYRNTRVTYEANNASYLYDSDGIPQILATSEVSVLSVNGQTGNVVLTAADVGAQEKLTAGTSITISNQNVISAPPVDTVLDKTSPNPISNSAVATAIDTITTELDRTVVYDLEMASDANSVTFTEDKIDVVTGVTSQEIDVIPTASADTAGTITAAEFRSITASQERLDALENGSVAIADLPASPTQQELTTAWLNATDQEELINRASIYDITNSKVWTYYTNILLWEETPAGAISVNPFTNNTAGTILGSTTDGAISANLDGTGSVSGWSALKQTVSEKANSADLATVATTGAYSDLIGAPSLATVATSGDYDDLINKPTIGNATLTIQKNGTDVQTFTANATSDVTANISVPTDLSELSGKVTASQIDEEAITTDTISGSGTDISLNGTMDGAVIDDVKLKGDTTQTTYTGKNLYNLTSSGTSYTVTYTGTTFGFTLSGTASASGNRIGIGSTTLPAGTYTATTFFDSGTISATTPFILYKGTTWNAVTPFWGMSFGPTSEHGTYKSATFTLTEETTLVFHVYFDSTVTLTDVKGRFQIESGSSYTSFEPYVGGVASPNPDYPQDVNTVTGEQTITTVGKNLWNPTLYKTGYTINSQGQDYAITDGAQWQYTEVLPNTKYTMSLTRGTHTGTVYIHAFASDGTWIEELAEIPMNSSTTNRSVTFTTSASIGILRWGFYDDATNQQLELGETATTYEPYQGVTRTINLGKNLLLPSPKSSASSGLTASYDATTGVITLSGVASNNWSNAFNDFSVNLPAGTYTFSSTTEAGLGRNIIFFNGATNILQKNLSATATSVECVVPQAITSLRLWLSPTNGADYTGKTFTVQLEKGSTATTFAPYFAPIELCKIGTYQDYIYKSGEDWYAHKEIGKETLPTSGYTLWDTQPTACMFYQNVETTNALYQEGSDTILSQQFTTYPQVNTMSTYYNNYGATNSYGLTFKTATHGVAIQNKDCADLNAFHTWIASNPVTIYYALATATDTQITNSALIAQLNAVKGLTTYDGQTNIAVSGDLPAILDVTTAADSKLAPNSVYSSAIRDGAVTVDKIASLQALADALAPYLSN